MAEDRMIRASMRSSEKVNGWPITLRYFWTQLWGYCDSYGRGRRDSRLIVADTFPMDEEVDAKTVERWMRALETAGVIEVYEVAGKSYFECLNWAEHQDIKYQKKTDIPDRSGAIPSTSKSSKKVSKLSHQGEGEGEVEGEIEGEGKSAPTPFCNKHPGGTDEPCRACGNARRVFDAVKAAPEVIQLPPRSDQNPDDCNHKVLAGFCVHCGTAEAASA